MSDTPDPTFGALLRAALAHLLHTPPASIDGALKARLDALDGRFASYDTRFAGIDTSLGMVSGAEQTDAMGIADARTQVAAIRAERVPPERTGSAALVVADEAPAPVRRLRCAASRSATCIRSTSVEAGCVAATGCRASTPACSWGAPSFAILRRVGTAMASESSAVPVNPASVVVFSSAAPILF